MVQVAVNLVDGQHTLLKLDALERSMDDWTSTLTYTAAAWYREAKRRFDYGDANSSMPGSKERWRPLSQMRVANRDGREHPILVDTGGLRDAATGGSGWGGDVSGSRTATATSLEMSISGDKVRNNFGFVTDEGDKVPQREFWGWESGEHDLLFEPFLKWADRKITDF